MIVLWLAIERRWKRQHFFICSCQQMPWKDQNQQSNLKSKTIYHSLPVFRTWYILFLCALKLHFPVTPSLFLRWISPLWGHRRCKHVLYDLQGLVTQYYLFPHFVLCALLSCSSCVFFLLHLCCSLTDITESSLGASHHITRCQILAVLNGP